MFLEISRSGFKQLWLISKTAQPVVTLHTK